MLRTRVIPCLLLKNESLVKRAKAASQRVKSGDYISQEEVEKEVENW